MGYAEREAAYRATLGPEELAHYDAYQAEVERQEAEFKAKMSPEELAGYLAWCEALDRLDAAWAGEADVDASLCNKPVDGGRCLLWRKHQGDCARYMGP